MKNTNLKNKHSNTLQCLLLLGACGMALITGFYIHKLFNKSQSTTTTPDNNFIIDNKYIAIGECGTPHEIKSTNNQTGKIHISFGTQCFCSARRIADNKDSFWIAAMNPAFESGTCTPEDQACRDKNIEYINKNCPQVCQHTCWAILNYVWEHWDTTFND